LNSLLVFGLHAKPPKLFKRLLMLLPFILLIASEAIASTDGFRVSNIFSETLSSGGFYYSCNEI